MVSSGLVQPCGPQRNTADVQFTVACAAASRTARAWNSRQELLFPIGKSPRDLPIVIRHNVRLCSAGRLSGSSHRQSTEEERWAARKEIQEQVDLAREIQAEWEATIKKWEGR